MARCYRCGQTVIYALNERAKSIAVDADPSPEGEVLITQGNGMKEATFLPKGSQPGLRTFHECKGPLPRPR